MSAATTAVRPCCMRLASIATCRHRLSAVCRAVTCSARIACSRCPLPNPSRCNNAIDAPGLSAARPRILRYTGRRKQRGPSWPGWRHPGWPRMSLKLMRATGHGGALHRQGREVMSQRHVCDELLLGNALLDLEFSVLHPADIAVEHSGMVFLADE